MCVSRNIRARGDERTNVPHVYYHVRNVGFKIFNTDMPGRDIVYTLMCVQDYGLKATSLYTFTFSPMLTIFSFYYTSVLASSPFAFQLLPLIHTLSNNTLLDGVRRDDTCLATSTLCTRGNSNAFISVNIN